VLLGSGNGPLRMIAGGGDGESPNRALVGVEGRETRYSPQM